MRWDMTWDTRLLVMLEKKLLMRSVRAVLLIIKQSARVVQVLEKNGEGLNLTWEVIDGILNHRTSGESFYSGGTGGKVF